MRPYSKDFEVQYYEINKYREATPISLLNYLEETAISHSDAVGYGMERLYNDGIGWVLNRWLVEISRYPMWNEKITVETWPSSFERFYANREFLVKDSGGNIIAKAASLWIFLNINSRRPIRIPIELGDVYGIHPVRTFDCTFGKLESADKYTHNRDFFIRKSDIDTNNHVNNAKYLDWMLEAIPDDIYHNYTLSTLEIQYKKELTYGTKVHSGCIDAGTDGHGIAFIHGISNDEGTECALGKTTWIKRSSQKLQGITA